METRDKNYFYLREIILGLRQEYVENEKMINQLVNKYVTINLDGVEDIYSYIKKHGNDYYFILELRKRQSLLMKLIQNFTNTVANDYYQKRKELFNVDDVRRDYFLCKDEELINISNPNNFFGYIDKLMLNDFNTALDDSYKHIESEDMSIKLGHEGIFTFTGDKRKYAPKTGIDYLSNQNQLRIIDYYKSASPKGINKILDSKIPSSLVDTRLQDIILANPDFSLPIELEGFSYSKEHQYFELEKQNDVVLARRVR